MFISSSQCSNDIELPDAGRKNSIQCFLMNVVLLAMTQPLTYEVRDLNLSNLTFF